MTPYEDDELERLLTEAERHTADCVCFACFKRNQIAGRANAYTHDDADLHAIDVDDDTIAVRCAIAGLLAICVLLGILAGVAAYNGWL